MEMLKKTKSSDKIQWTRYYRALKNNREYGDACLETLAKTEWAEELCTQTKQVNFFWKRNPDAICNTILQKRKDEAIDFYDVSTPSCTNTHKIPG